MQYWIKSNGKLDKSNIYMIKKSKKYDIGHYKPKIEVLTSKNKYL